jgi:hypothetical protein
LANLESINAQFIGMEISQQERLVLLNQTAITQMQSLLRNLPADYVLEGGLHPHRGEITNKKTLQ